MSWNPFPMYITSDYSDNYKFKLCLLAGCLIRSSPLKGHRGIYLNIMLSCFGKTSINTSRPPAGWTDWFLQFADWSTFSFYTSTAQQIVSPSENQPITTEKSLTVLIWRVLHSVRPVAFVRDVGIRVGARRIGNARFDVTAAALIVSSSVHNEMCSDFS